MPTTYANSINNNPIYADRAEKDAAGNTISTTYATKGELPDGVPAVTSSDDAKVLKATYSGGVGSYAWETESGGTQVQSDWQEADTTDPSYIQNKPLDIGITEGTGITFTNSGASISIGVTIPLPSFDPNSDVGKVLKITSGGVLAWVTP